MKLSDVLSNFEITPLVLTDLNKNYIFSCTLDNASILENDFIFIPITSQLNETVADLLECAMRNPHCKGFVLNHAALAQEQFKPLFHLLMNKYYTRTEVVLLVKNIYNFACFLAAENQKKYNTNIITVAGTHETSIISDLIVSQFKDNQLNILSNKNYWSCWQKIIENILLADENTKYAIIEAIPEKKGLMGIVAKYINNYIIFNVPEIFKTSTYSDLFDLHEELRSVLQHPQNIISIISSEDNEIIDSSIDYNLQNKFYTAELPINNNLPSLSRAESITAKFMEILNLQYNKEILFDNCFYNCYKKENINYFIINSSINPYINTIKFAMDLFFEQYKSYKKIVIFDFIEDISIYKQSIYSEIFEHLARLKPDILFLLNIEKYSNFYKKYEKNTYVKTVDFISKDLYSVNEFRNIFRRYLDDNTAVFVYSKQEVV